ncbi:MAG: hypothetical protein ACFFDH_24705, partial [Promethearchaeota archaeon]
NLNKKTYTLPMDSKTEKKNNIKVQERETSIRNSINPKMSTYELVDENIVNLCDENLSTLQKIHAILLNCVNLSKKQKLEFCESERYFMKLYLKKLRDQNNNI